MNCCWHTVATSQVTLNSALDCEAWPIGGGDEEEVPPETIGTHAEPFRFSGPGIVVFQPDVSVVAPEGRADVVQGPLMRPDGPATVPWVGVAVQSFGFRGHVAQAGRVTSHKPRNAIRRFMPLRPFRQ